MINRLLFRSRQFCDKYCFADGFINILNSAIMGKEISSKILYDVRLMYDYDYYAFTKSTKTLHAIKCLLKDKEYHFNEDVTVLVRSIFENHIMSRYFRENISDLDIENNRLETLLYVVFTFTKILEGVATVEGEDYDTCKEEKLYYDLVYDSLELQKSVFDYLIENNNGYCDSDLIFIAHYLYDEASKGYKIESSKSEMLINMKKSLDEEIGSVKKSRIDKDGKYIRSKLKN